MGKTVKGEQKKKFGKLVGEAEYKKIYKIQGEREKKFKWVSSTNIESSIPSVIHALM